jgi:hypothetical protein
MLGSLFRSYDTEIWFVLGIWFIGVAIIVAAFVLRSGRRP